jgi:hypothetical protein
MFKNLNNGKKIKLLLVGTGVMLVLIYFFSIKETVDLAIDCSEKEMRLEQAKGTVEKMAVLKGQIRKVDAQLGGNKDTTTKVMDLLLQHISEYCSKNGCVLKEIPTPEIANKNSYQIESSFITLQGRYKDLLGLVYLLEQKKKTGGHIASLKFYTVKNQKLKKEELLLTLYVQHYQKI